MVIRLGSGKLMTAGVREVCHEKMYNTRRILIVLQENVKKKKDTGCM